jgi:hypothetical protein
MQFPTEGFWTFERQYNTVGADPLAYEALRLSDLPPK